MSGETEEMDPLDQSVMTPSRSLEPSLSRSFSEDRWRRATESSFEYSNVSLNDGFSEAMDASLGNLLVGDIHESRPLGHPTNGASSGSSPLETIRLAAIQARQLLESTRGQSHSDTVTFLYDLLSGLQDQLEARHANTTTGGVSGLDGDTSMFFPSRYTTGGDSLDLEGGGTGGESQLEACEAMIAQLTERMNAAETLRIESTNILTAEREAIVTAISTLTKQAESWLEFDTPPEPSAVNAFIEQAHAIQDTVTRGITAERLPKLLEAAETTAKYEYQTHLNDMLENERMKWKTKCENLEMEIKKLNEDALGFHEEKKILEESLRLIQTENEDLRHKHHQMECHVTQQLQELRASELKVISLETQLRNQENMNNLLEDFSKSSESLSNDTDDRSLVMSSDDDEDENDDQSAALLALAGGISVTNVSSSMIVPPTPERQFPLPLHGGPPSVLPSPAKPVADTSSIGLLNTSITSRAGSMSLEDEVALLRTVNATLRDDLRRMKASQSDISQNAGNNTSFASLRQVGIAAGILAGAESTAASTSFLLGGDVGGSTGNTENVGVADSTLSLMSILRGGSGSLLATTVVDLERENESLSGEIAAVTSKLEVTTNEMTALSLANSALGLRFDSLDRELAEARAKEISSTMESRLREIELEGEIDVLKGHISNLKTQTASLRRELKDRKDELQLAIEARNELEGKLLMLTNISTTGQTDSERDEMLTAQRIANQVASENSELSEQLSKLSSHLDEKSAALEAAEERCNALEAALFETRNLMITSAEEAKLAAEESQRIQQTAIKDAMTSAQAAADAAANCDSAAQAASTVSLELAVARSEISRLNDELAGERVTLSSCRSTINTTRDAIRLLIGRLESHLMDFNGEVKDKLSNLEARLLKASGEIKILQPVVSSISAENHRLQNELLAAQSTAEHAKDELRRLTERAEQEAAKAEAAHIAHEKLLASLEANQESELNATRQLLSIESTAAMAAAQCAADEAKAQAAVAIVEASAAKDELADMRQRLRTAELTREALSADQARLFAATVRVLAALEADAVRHKAAADGLRASVAKLTGDLRRATADVAKGRALSHRCQQAIAAESAAMKRALTAEENVRSLRLAAIQNEKALIAAEEKAAVAATDEIDRLTRQLSKLEESLGEVENQRLLAIDGCRAKEIQDAAEISSLNLRIAKLEADLHSCSEDMIQSRQAFLHEEERVKFYMEKNEALTLEYSESIRQVTEDYNNVLFKVTKAEKDVAEGKEKIVHLTTELRIAREKLSVTENALATANSTSVSRLADSTAASRQMSELEARVDDLQRELSRLEKITIPSLEAERDDALANLSQLKEAHALEISRDWKPLQLQVSELSDALATAEETVASLERCQEDMARQLEVMTVERNETLESLHEQSLRAVESETSVSLLTADLKAARELYESSLRTIDDAKYEIDSLHNRLESEIAVTQKLTAEKEDLEGRMIVIEDHNRELNGRFIIQSERENMVVNSMSTWTALLRNVLDGETVTLPPIPSSHEESENGLSSDSLLQLELRSLLTTTSHLAESVITSRRNLSAERESHETLSAMVEHLRVQIATSTAERETIVSRFEKLATDYDILRADADDAEHRTASLVDSAMKSTDTIRQTVHVTITELHNRLATVVTTLAGTPGAQDALTTSPEPIWQLMAPGTSGSAFVPSGGGMAKVGASLDSTVSVVNQFTDDTLTSIEWLISLATETAKATEIALHRATTAEAAAEAAANALDGDLRELTSRCESLVEEADAARQAAADAMSEAEAAKKAAEVATNDANSARAATAELNSQMASLTASYQATLTALANAEALVISNQTAIASATNSANISQAALEDAQATIASLKKANATAEINLTRSQAAVNRLRQEKEVGDGVIRSLESELAAQRSAALTASSVSALTGNAAEMSSAEIERLLSMLSVTMGKARETLVVEKDTMPVTPSSTVGEGSDSDTALITIPAEGNDKSVSQRVTDAMDSLAWLRIALREDDKYHRRQQHTIQNLTNQNLNLNSELKSLRENFDVLQQDHTNLLALAEERAEKIALLKETLTEVEGTTVDFQSSMNEANQVFVTLTERATAAEESVKMLQQKLAVAEKAFSVREIEWKSTLTSVETAHQTLTQREESLAASERTIAQLRSEVELSVKAASKLGEELNNEREKRLDLENRLRLITDAEQSAANVTQEIARLTAALNSSRGELRQAISACETAKMQASDAIREKDHIQRTLVATQRRCELHAKEADLLRKEIGRKDPSTPGRSIPNSTASSHVCASCQADMTAMRTELDYLRNQRLVAIREATDGKLIPANTSTAAAPNNELAAAAITELRVSLTKALANVASEKEAHALAENEKKILAALADKRGDELNVALQAMSIVRDEIQELRVIVRESLRKLNESSRLMALDTHMSGAANEVCERLVSLVDEVSAKVSQDNTNAGNEWRVGQGISLVDYVGVADLVASLSVLSKIHKEQRSYLRHSRQEDNELNALRRRVVEIETQANNTATRNAEEIESLRQRLAQSMTTATTTAGSGGNSRIHALEALVKKEAEARNVANNEIKRLQTQVEELRQQNRAALRSSTIQSSSNTTVVTTTTIEQITRLTSERDDLRMALETARRDRDAASLHASVLTKTIENMESRLLSSLDTVVDAHINAAISALASLSNSSDEDACRWDAIRHRTRAGVLGEALTVYRAGLLILFPEATAVIASDRVVAATAAATAGGATTDLLKTIGDSICGSSLFTVVGLAWHERQLLTLQRAYEEELNTSDKQLQAMTQALRHRSKFLNELQRQYEEQAKAFIRHGTSHHDAAALLTNGWNRYTESMKNDLRRLNDELNRLRDENEAEKSAHRHRYSRIVEDLAHALKARDAALLSLRRLEEFCRTHRLDISAIANFDLLSAEISTSSSSAPLRTTNTGFTPTGIPGPFPSMSMERPRSASSTSGSIRVISAASSRATTPATSSTPNNNVGAMERRLASAKVSVYEHRATVSERRV